MFSLRTAFIGFATGATSLAMVSNSQAQTEDITCEPFHFVGITCDQATREPLAVFNECSKVNLSVGIIDLQTGKTMTILMRDYQDNIYKSTRDGLAAQMKLKKSDPELNTAQSIAEMEEGLRAIDEAKKATVCTPL